MAFVWIWATYTRNYNSNVERNTMKLHFAGSLRISPLCRGYSTRLWLPTAISIAYSLCIFEVHTSSAELCTKEAGDMDSSVHTWATRNVNSSHCFVWYEINDADYHIVHNISTSFIPIPSKAIAISDLWMYFLPTFNIKSIFAQNLFQKDINDTVPIYV